MTMGDRKSNETPILSVKDLHVAYGKILALKGISFDVYPGEIVSILGANGAGKTTTINTLTGVLRAKSGTALFKGQNILGIPTHKITQMGMVQVPEGRHIFPDLTVAENLRVAAFLYEKKNKPLYEERKEYVFGLFPKLKERLSQAGGTLSGGEQQMLAIGRALITGSDLLLLDEPSMGIAPNLVIEIFDNIQKIAAQGQTIMLVEQNAMMASEIADYCYVLETGTVAFEGTSEKIKGDSHIVEAYLG